ncbi:MAG: YlxR family protein [Firmicutes bacterium]|nr:YlxR family protein [Bacillota bacterium]
MKAKKIPMRSCCVTREKLPKQELVRVVRTPEGSIVVDTTGKANGRGAYLKKDITVFEKAEKSKILNKHLETEIPSSIFEELKNLVK